MSLGFTSGISVLTSRKTPSETASRADSYPTCTHRLRTGPPPRAVERLAPAAEQLVALALGHRGLVGGRLAPHLPYLACGPLPGRDPGQVRGAQRRRLSYLRDDHRHPEHIGLELHQPGV